MQLLRFPPVSTLVLLVLAMSLPSSAAAATAPTLTAPAAAVSATEGGSMKFEWTGALQGDPDAIDRSFFRLEVIKTSNMPAGAQAAWPDASLENSQQTEPGSTSSTISIGVPTTGDYRWRVCAWGVVDDLTANEITQLPGGCSASRAFSTVAAATGGGTIGELKMEEKTQVAGETRTVYVERETPPTTTTTDTTPVEPAPPIQEAVEEIVETTFTSIAPTSVERGSGSAIGGLGGDDPGGLTADSAASRKGVGGAVMTGLSSTLPFVPIPFWTLALLLACFPLARIWRTSVLGMFDWNDGSIDGRGGFDEVLADLSFVPLDQEVKDGSTTADGIAAAPASVVHPSVPDRGRHAA